MVSRIDELRAEVRKRQQAVNRKIRRTEGNGARIANTKYDPRRDVDISRMRSRDLNNYLTRLNTFMDRKNQFIPGTGGQPIHISVWRGYKRAERAANRRADRLFKQVANVKLPGGDMTIGSRHASVTNTDFPSTANHTVNSPLRKVNRQLRSMPSEKAIRRLTKQQQDKVDPQFLKLFVKRGRQEAYKMLNALNDTEITKELKGLTDKQFHILWAYTEFATNTSIRYEEGKRDTQNKDIEDNEISESRAWINWVKNVK